MIRSMAWQLPEDTALRHTLFADAIIAGKTPRDAALAVGYPAKGAYETGRELSLKPEIIALIDTRRSLLPDATDWTPVRIVQELASLAQQARDDGQYATARQCYRDIGEHIGMWPKTPVNIDARSQTLALPALDDDTLRALAAMTVPAIDAPSDTE